ncbi:hypothetical protein ACFL56_03090 [Candidatus Margulisiibacteriota bacterium]
MKAIFKNDCITVIDKAVFIANSNKQKEVTIENIKDSLNTKDIKYSPIKENELPFSRVAQRFFKFSKLKAKGESIKEIKLEKFKDFFKVFYEEVKK